MIKNRPNEFAIPAISIDFHSCCPSILIAPLTLSELEKKKIKNNGAYIANTNNISG